MASTLKVFLLLVLCAFAVAFPRREFMADTKAEESKEYEGADEKIGGIILIGFSAGIIALVSAATIVYLTYTGQKALVNLTDLDQQVLLTKTRLEEARINVVELEKEKTMYLERNHEYKNLKILSNTRTKLIVGELEEQIKFMQKQGIQEAKQTGDPNSQPYFRKTEKQLVAEVKNEQQKFLQMMRQTIKDVEQSRMQHKKEVANKIQEIHVQHAAAQAAQQQKQSKLMQMISRANKKPPPKPSKPKPVQEQDEIPADVSQTQRKTADESGFVDSQATRNSQVAVHDINVTDARKNKRATSAFRRKPSHQSETEQTSAVTTFAPRNRSDTDVQMG